MLAPVGVHSTPSPQSILTAAPLLSKQTQGVNYDEFSMYQALCTTTQTEHMCIFFISALQCISRRSKLDLKPQPSLSVSPALSYRVCTRVIRNLHEEYHTVGIPSFPPLMEHSGLFSADPCTLRHVKGSAAGGSAACLLLAYFPVLHPDSISLWSFSDKQHKTLGREVAGGEKLGQVFRLQVHCVFCFLGEHQPGSVPR